MLGKRLEELRIKKGLKKREVAKVLNVHESTYGKYELNKNEPEVATLQKLAKYFDVSVDYLLGISPTPNPLPSDTAALLEQIEELKSKLSQSQAENAVEEKIIKQLSQLIVEMTDLISQAQDAIAIISKLKNENNV